MEAYSKSYLDEVCETQGKFFDYMLEKNPNLDCENFIISYMQSKTRSYIDNSQAYVMTLNYKDLYEYFFEVDDFKVKDGNRIDGFMLNWIGQFYSYYQWFYNIKSVELVKKITVSFLEKSYNGLHDLSLKDAVIKVGRVN